MKSWVNVEADVNKIMQKHFTPGRTAKINKIVIHHNAGNLTTEDCYRAWQTREASAHYQVEITGRIGQLVWDENTAWHATGANANGIGIEHANNKMGPYWTISDATLENGAHLVAALCLCVTGLASGPLLPPPEVKSSGSGSVTVLIRSSGSNVYCVSNSWAPAAL